MSRSVIPNSSQETKGASKDIAKDLSNPFLQTSNIAFNKTGKTILNYKILIKWLDIITSVLIILGCIISQVENENNYNYNLNNRILSINLISDIYYNTTKPIEEYNLTMFLNEKSIKKVNFSDYTSVSINIEINENCNNLRYIILVTTLISVPLIIVSRYIEYRRDYLYKMKSESKIIFFKNIKSNNKILN